MGVESHPGWRVSRRSSVAAEMSLPRIFPVFSSRLSVFVAQFRRTKTRLLTVNRWPEREMQLPAAYLLAPPTSKPPGAGCNK